ncbi:ATP-grasp domain-containing protein [Burkholderia gladioli]|uniref:ATP-grasp domain-containing protein n=1 Tax=Burkholderia gladioli TaxID=28095 RepID=UPI001641D39B|nr:ATP-grasp domain-containing protein [Burkholderia gladioli]
MSSDTLKTVLVTAAGTATAVNVIKRLTESLQLRVVTTDSNPRSLIAAPTRWNTTHYQIPLAREREAFISSLLEICENEHVDAVYPIHDAEILAVVENRSRFPQHVQLPSVSSDAIRDCNDKLLNYQACRKAGLPVPTTVSGTALTREDLDAHGQLIRKPRFGVGSVGVKFIVDFDQIDPPSDLNTDVIFQTVCQGKEYTIDVVSTGKSVFSVVRERLETKAGVCTKARVFRDARVDQLAQGIAATFDFIGMFCFQIIGNIESGKFSIIDINPRCGGGTALTAAAGYPIYEWHFATMLGLQNADDHARQCLEKAAQGGESIVCRHYEEVVTHQS